MGMVALCVEVSPTQWKALEASPDSVYDLLDLDTSKATSLDLDKSWHGIHYLLTGEAWGGNGPAAKAILGGTEFGDDAGYGPARYLTPEEVQDLAVALTALPKEALQRRYEPAALEAADVYPSGIWECEGQGAFDYLMSYYDKLVAFYKAAANNGNGVVLVIS